MKSKKFSNAEDQKINDVLCTVWDALEYKDFKPDKQLMYYILTEDPIYITNYNSARSLITKIEREDIIKHLLDYYFNN